MRKLTWVLLLAVGLPAGFVVGALLNPVIAQSATPQVSVVHTTCFECEVWLSSAPNGFSGVHAVFVEERDTSPPESLFFFGGSNPGDLTSVVHIEETHYFRSDIEGHIGPTTDPILLLTYTGPVMQEPAISFDEQGDDVTLRFEP